MGTQPSRKLTRRGTKVRTRKFKKELDSHISKGDYKKAAYTVSKAVRESGGSDYITGILAAGISAYRSPKTTTEQSIKKISGNAVSKIPSDIKKNLTLAGKDSIRQALYNTLSDRGEN